MPAPQGLIQTFRALESLWCPLLHLAQNETARDHQAQNLPTSLLQLTEGFFLGLPRVTI